MLDEHKRYYDELNGHWWGLEQRASVLLAVAAMLAVALELLPGVSADSLAVVFLIPCYVYLGACVVFALRSLWTSAELLAPQFHKCFAQNDSLAAAELDGLIKSYVEALRGKLRAVDHAHVYVTGAFVALGLAVLSRCVPSIAPTVSKEGAALLGGVGGIVGAFFLELFRPSRKIAADESSAKAD